MKFKVHFSMYSGDCSLHLLKRDIDKAVNKSGNGWMSLRAATERALETKLEKMQLKKIHKFLQKNDSNKLSISVDWFERIESKKQGR